MPQPQKRDRSDALQSRCGPAIHGINESQVFAAKSCPVSDRGLQVRWRGLGGWQGKMRDMRPAIGVDVGALLFVVFFVKKW
jgi:hypothetical protein